MVAAMEVRFMVRGAGSGWTIRGGTATGRQSDQVWVTLKGEEGRYVAASFWETLTAYTKQLGESPPKMLHEQRAILPVTQWA